MRMKTLFRWMKSRAVMLLAVVCVGGITAFVTLFELNSLMPGANSYEVASQQTLASLTSSPLTNPIDIPYFVVAKIISLVVSDLAALRFTSAVLGIATIGLMSYVLRQWFNNRIAVVGALLMATSSWYLHLSRTGAPFILMAFWLSVFLAIGTWRTYTVKPLFTDILIAIAVALSLYSPYFIWLTVVGVIVLAIRRKRQFFVLPRKHQIVLPIVFLICIAPLIYSIAMNVDIARQLAGLQTLPTSFLEYAKQLGQNVAMIFFRGFTNPSLNLGRLPFLDIFSAVMVALGILYYESQRGLRRSQLLLGATVVLGLTISITPFEISKLAVFFPVVMVFAVAGIVELLTRWLKSFPRNPIARSVGVGVIVLAIGFTSHYHLQRYFVAWAGNPDAVQAHSVEL